MVIDVIDLDFETLNFKRRYEPGRYKRGTNIYNEGNVVVEKVEKNDDNSIYINAEVQSRYDTYETNLKIVGNMITESSCTCEDYFNGNLCKHIIATSLETIKPHYASTEEGKDFLWEKEREETRKRLEEYKKFQEEQRRREEYERKYRNGLSIIRKFSDNIDTDELSNDFNLKSFYTDIKEQKNNNVGKLADSIKLECIVEYINNKTLKVSFKIGQNRMYVLNNLSDFYKAYLNEEELYYGKQLRFIPKRDNFIDESKCIFDFIVKFSEILDYNNTFNNEYSRYSYKSSSKEIYITGDNIEELLRINNNNLTIKTYNEGIGEYKCVDDKLDIKCNIEKEMVTIYSYINWYEREEEESEEYVFRLNIENYKVLYSNKKIYVFYNNKIYKLDKTENLISLFEIFDNEEKVLIPEDKLVDFGKNVLSKIKYFQTENLPEIISNQALLVNELATKVLLDSDDKGNLLLELKFCYNDFEFNILENYVIKENIVRDIPKEKEILSQIFKDGFEYVAGKKYFVMKNEDDIYYFLSQKIEKYMNDFEVLVTDKFKNKQIRQPKISNIGIKVDNGLLELDISKINIDIKELKNVLKDYNIKKKYYKLKSGDFLDLTDNEDLNLLSEMTSTLDIDYSKINHGVVNLPINRSIYLEQLLNSNKNINISKNDKFNEIIDNIENSEISDNIKINKKFEKLLRDYQKVGYKWLKTLEMYKFGGILADDMGLGKTLQIIALLKNEIDSNKKSTSIVVCPSTLVLNWKAEIEKWCNDIKVLNVKGSAEERKNLLLDYKKYNLIITSYDLLKRDVDNYEGMNFKYIIADEAQYVKNYTTQNATSLKSLKGEIRFALTGTPIENSVAELWSIFDFIMPGYLYNYNKFKKNFEEPILKLEDKETLKRLKKLISPFILRRVKKDVLTELPEKNITIMKNEMDSEQEKLYLAYLAQTKEEVSKELEQSGFEKNKLKILMLLTRLRQICCHPSLFIENYNGNCGKLKQCMDLVSDAIESGHKILLFSSYTSMFDIIEKELDKINVKYFKLAGSTPVNKRVEMVDEFNSNDDIKVFLISLKAGGTGLNLTSADVVIHYDPWWNVSSENQATDRAYRIGQKNSVQVYKLITSNSIEEKINKMQERKELLSNDLLSTEETFINKLSKEEILDLFN